MFFWLVLLTGNVAGVVFFCFFFRRGNCNMICGDVWAGVGGWESAEVPHCQHLPASALQKTSIKHEDETHQFDPLKTKIERYIEPEKSSSARTVSFLGLRFHSSLSSEKKVVQRFHLVVCTETSRHPVLHAQGSAALWWTVEGKRSQFGQSGRGTGGSGDDFSWFRWGLDLAPSPVLLWNKFGGRNILSSHKVTTKLRRIWEVEIITISTWQ